MMIAFLSVYSVYVCFHLLARNISYYRPTVWRAYASTITTSIRNVGAFLVNFDHKMQQKVKMGTWHAQADLDRSIERKSHSAN